MNKCTDWNLEGENIVSEFFKSKKNSNRLLELEELLLSSDEECVLSMFPFVYDVFSKVFSMGLLRSDGKNTDYKLWLLGRYEDFISHLLSFLSHKNEKIQSAALQNLLLFMKLESESPRKDENESSNFPIKLFKRIVSCIASDVLNQKELIEELKKYTKYNDIKLYLLKTVDLLLHSSEQVTECFLQNCFLLLCSVKFPKNFDGAVETFAYRSDSQQPFQLKEKQFKKIFSTVWNNLLNYQMSSEFLLKVVSALNENVLPHLQNPCLMTDFLTNCYNKGGVVSLLALKGLYILMDKYNLEYPDFFVKLYALLEKNIINGKFSFKFFELTDLFLSSTHLPAHIVAAFAKKMSRFSLVSSADTVVKIICLVSNLLVNHPSLHVLLHNMDGKECCEDPFSMDAVDPAESNAMKSSLWEIKALRCHVNPDVCRKAKELTAAYPKFGSSISDVSNVTLYDMYKKSRKRKLNDVPLAICKPSIKKRNNQS